MTLLAAAPDNAEAKPPLVLVGMVRLDHVSGRIDHMAVDLGRRRLMVAEFENNTLDIIDLTALKPVHRLTGLDEPQGAAYLADSDMIAVANGGDGSLWLYRAGDFSTAGRVDLGSDADNIRIDPRTGRLVVGVGGGALATVDGAGPRQIMTVPLPAHPEGFQIDAATGRAYVNIPNAGEIATVDLAAGKQVASWRLGGLRANFPMVLDAANHRVIVVTRQPPRLVALSMATGGIEAQISTCGDADDVFRDAERRRLYVSCGAGAIDVIADGGDRLHRIARIPTASGARTSLFVPELDRLYVARRATFPGDSAAILIFRPMP